MSKKKDILLQKRVKNMQGDSVGARLKSLRLSLCLTQDQMCADLSTGTDYVGRLERGDMLPSASFLIRLHKTYCVDLSMLLCGPIE
jgi:transcriptional regulator with XRE-family HTH domain